MHRALLTILTVFLSCTPVFAQVIGIHGGWSRASVDGNDAGRAGFVSGIWVGATVSLPG